MGELHELLQEAGIDSRRLRHALTLLGDGRWWDLAGLVKATATSRRTIERLLGTVRLERDGDRFRLARPYDDVAEPGPALAGPADHLTDTEMTARMRKVISRAPRARADLDHVVATADTVLRRALVLAGRFHLPGARILCVGDHDLTSVAIRMVCPEADVMVADVDERTLEHIASADPEIRCRWADLRLGLPASARGWADLAVTDPPYTPEGVGLFVARGLEAMRDRKNGRVALAYGSGETVPALGLKVQGELHRLGLLIEAMWPDFNAYYGAEAIGSAADLYLLRPTSTSWPALQRRAATTSTKIYTKGSGAVQAAIPEPPADLFRDASAGARVLVGDWPADVAPDVPRARLSTWLAKPYKAAPASAAIVLPAGFPGTLPRALLATRADRVTVIVPAPLPDLPPAVGEVYDVTTRPVGDWIALTAVRRPPGGVLRAVLDSAHGRLENTWREALTADRGMTKNAARSLIADTAPWALGTSVLELPAHRLRDLADRAG